MRLRLLCILLSSVCLSQAQSLTKIPKRVLDQDYVVSAQVEQVSSPWSQGKMRVCRGLRLYQPRLTRLSLRGDSLCIVMTDDRRKSSTCTLPVAKQRGQSLYVDMRPYFAQVMKGVDVISGRYQPGTLTDVQVNVLQDDAEHLEARVDYTYRTDSVPYCISVRKALVRLAEQPMARRNYDPRVGYRCEVRDCISRFDIDRREHVTFYVDSAFSPLWQEAICQGIEDWNRAFAALGRPDLIQAVPMSRAGRRFDPFAFGTNMFWCVDSEFANAEGKHYCDPRSGEILTASVLFYSNVIERLRSWYFLQTAAYNPEARQVLPDSTLRRIIRYAAAHEVGHCLGLEHNFRASFAYATDSLRDPSFCARCGTTPSIMDYARFNYVAQPGDGVTQVCPPYLGDYDIYAIQAGYGQFGTDAEYRAYVDAHQSQSVCLYKRLMRRSQSDADAIDVQASDLGNDALASTEYGIRNLRYIDGHIAQWNPGHADPYEGMPASRSELQQYYFELLGHLLPGRDAPAQQAMLQRELTDGYRFLLQPEAAADTAVAAAARRANAQVEAARSKMLAVMSRPAARPQALPGLLLPHQLTSDTVMAMLHNEGLALSAQQINSINEACVNQAILSVSQDGGTFSPTSSAAFISADGLVLTNFHSVRRYIERLSDRGPEYLRYGCYAQSREEEAPLFGLQLNQLLWCTDVTDSLCCDLSDTLTVRERQAVVSQRAEEMMKRLPKSAKESYRAYSMMGGTQYVVAKYRSFNDVRIVAAPPQSLAMEGGDTVNWRWPRVSADFAVLRVYGSAKNKPANYHKGNVPYHPETYLPLATDSVRPGELVLVAGYPAQTRKHIPWFAIDRIVNYDTRFRMEVSRAKMELLAAMMADGPARRQADCAARISSINNTYLRAKGEVEGTLRDNIIERRRLDDQALQQWICDDSVRSQRYGATLLADMQSNYQVLTQFNHMEEVFLQCVLNGPNVFPFAGKFEKLIAIDRANRKNRVRAMERELKDLHRNMQEFYAAFDYDLDLAMMKLLVPYYLKGINAAYVEEDILRQASNLDSLYAHSMLTDSARLYAWVDKVVEEGTQALQDDALYRFLLSFYVNRVSRINRDAISFRRRNSDLYALYMTALSEYQQGSTPVIDANKTLRYSAGRVGELSHKPGVPVPCCFTSTAETAAGQSGSPVLNARGELIGLNFDREISSLSAIYYPRPSRTCNIMVTLDYIKYILSQSPSRYVLDELKR
ncbi:MAG: S46 family peptidase [Bacteroidales bacterium]|nr:S46 family peptidase [Bacteroidales bacterium]